MGWREGQKKLPKASDNEGMMKERREKTIFHMFANLQRPHVSILPIGVFDLSSLIYSVAALIIAKAVAGIGSNRIFSGAFIITTHSGACSFFAHEAATPPRLR